MARLRLENDRYRVDLYKPTDGKRTSVHLGRMGGREAERFLDKVELLITAVRTNTPDHEALRWAGKLPDRLHGRLAAAGLVEPRLRKTTPLTLEELLKEYSSTLAVKSSTRTRYEQAQARLKKHFGTRRRIDSIRTRDAEAWKVWLGASEGYAPATVSRDVGLARMIFRKAVRWGLLESNPFDDVRAGSQRNPERLHYVGPPESARVLEACPDADWRCIVALSRYGGLRCPSEVLRLRWSDIDWDGVAGHLWVRSPKTEHHEGKAGRKLPLFPELRAVLLDAFAAADEGAEFVVARHRDSTANLRTHMNRIIERAGLEPWPRLFNALRASRATELAAEYPAAVCSAWLGHSAAIAEAHYHMVRDSDLERAVRGQILAPFSAPSRAVGTRQKPTTKNKKPHSDGSRRVWAAQAGETNGRNRTRTCDLIHVTDAL